MLTPRKWYSLVLLRWGAGIVLWSAGWWLIYSSSMSWGWKVFLEIPVTGLIGGLLLMGPASYADYQRVARRIAEQHGKTP
jgi:hypothetical protein